MPNEIKALVLDLGQVLIRLDFSEVMTALGLPPDESIAQWLKNMDAWKAYDSFERGQISEDVFFETASEVKSVWNSVLKEAVPGITTLLKTIKKSTRLFALTNTNETHLRHAMSNYPFLGVFECIFSSHKIGARKPEPEIYRFVEKSIGISGAHILFIDDRIENVEGAKNVGWNAAHCQKSPEDLETAFHRFRLT